MKDSRGTSHCVRTSRGITGPWRGIRALLDDQGCDLEADVVPIVARRAARAAAPAEELGRAVACANHMLSRPIAKPSDGCKDTSPSGGTVTPR
jgi:hypothetical protein